MPPELLVEELDSIIVGMMLDLFRFFVKGTRRQMLCRRTLLVCFR